jgi:HEAT repeat protein
VILDPGAVELMDEQRAELRRWLAALSSDLSTERSDAAESPPEGALDDEIVTALVPLLRDSCDVVRLCAAETLGRYPGLQTVAALRAFVARETDPLARAHGLSSLGLTGTSQDVPTLLSETAEDRLPHIRIHALAGLYELVRRGVKIGLMSLLEHQTPEVRGAAAEALVTVLEDRDDDDAVQALEQCADRETIEARRDDLLEALRRLQGRDEEPDKTDL